MKRSLKASPFRSLPWLAGLVLVLGACATRPPRGTATNTYAGNEDGKRDEFIGDRELSQRFVLVDVLTKREDGRLRVQFDLKNTTGADLPIEWAIEWKDASGFRIATKPHWKPVIVPGSGFHSIQQTAPVPEAGMFQLHIRRPTPIS